MKGALCCLLLTVFIQSAEAAGDPFLGRWFLDVMQSKYPVGQCPKSMTIVMEAAGERQLGHASRLPQDLPDLLQMIHVMSRHVTTEIANRELPPLRVDTVTLPLLGCELRKHPEIGLAQQAEHG